MNDYHEMRLQYLALIEAQETINGRYSKIKRINADGGNGNFSLLFSALDVKTGSSVALKFFDPMQVNNSDRVARFHREAMLLEFLRDEPYVIDCMEGLCNLNVEGNYGDLTLKIPLIYIPMILADSNVEDLIYADPRPQPHHLIKVFKEMVKGVSRIHRRSICHRDLKPDNFLLAGSNVLVSDFGTAKIMDEKIPNIRGEYSFPVGHKHYWAPELIVGLGIGDEHVYRSDFFALGAILYEMFTGSYLTNIIYNSDIIEHLIFIGTSLDLQRNSDKSKVYLGAIEEFARSVKFPDIYAFNDRVPKCIKYQLNDLYKSLAAFSFKHRQANIVAIHRRLDICLKTLLNEGKYQKWLNEKKRRKAAKTK